MNRYWRNKSTVLCETTNTKVYDSKVSPALLNEQTLLLLEHRALLKLLLAEAEREYHRK